MSGLETLDPLKRELLEARFLGKVRRSPSSLRGVALDAFQSWLLLRAFQQAIINSADSNLSNRSLSSDRDDGGARRKRTLASPEHRAGPIGEIAPNIGSPARHPTCLLQPCTTARFNFYFIFKKKAKLHVSMAHARSASFSRQDHHSSKIVQCRSVESGEE